MTGGYLYWQFLSGPGWLLGLTINLQRTLARFFSVAIMLRTLVSHWHKDVVQYRGSISSRLLALAWNLISRGIGFLIRSVVLIVWVVTAIVLLIFSLLLFITFLAWPFLVAGALIWTVSLL